VTEEMIRARIRAMLSSGNLDCDDPARVWAGTSAGEICAACLAPIDPRSIEYEADLHGHTLHFHMRCHDIWLEECELGGRSRH